MSEQINPGDEVMLVWACCADTRRKFIGWRGVVHAITDDRYTSCKSCNRVIYPKDKMADIDLGIIPLTWLKKMPPDGEQIETREVEEIGAC